MSELMTVNDNQVAVQSSEASMAMQIMTMASNPDFDVEKLEKLMDLQEREMARLALVAFNQAFAEMQSQIPTVAKSKKGGDSNYATLEDVVEITRPILNRYGISTYFDTKTDISNNREVKDKYGNVNVIYDGNVIVEAILLHKMGHQIKTSLIVPFDFSGNKNSNTAQAMGSAVSYGKRYSLCALLNIATRDDNDARTSNVYAHKTITGAQARGLVTKRDKLDEASQQAFMAWLLNDFGIDSINDIKLQNYNYIDSQLTNKVNAAKEVAHDNP